MSAEVSPQEKLPLEEFPPATPAEWRAEAERALKGAPFEKVLVARTPEGIDLEPIYHGDAPPPAGSLPGFAPFVRGATASGHAVRPWGIAQAIPYGSAKDFNTAARHDVERGQTILLLSLDRAGRLGRDPDLAAPGEVGFCGTSIATTEDLARALAQLEDTPLHVQPGSSGLPLLALLVATLRRAGRNPSAVEGWLAQDPIGELMTEGSLPVETAFDHAAAVTRWTLEHMPRLATLGVTAQPCSDAGASAVQELAFALASGVESLRQMTARGLAVDDVAPRMRFAFPVGADFFMGIAKLRAARMLWQRIVSASGGGTDSQRMRLHARTALWNKTAHDPYVNMLRNTTETCAAVFGGCDSLHVGAFDEVVRPPDEFSRRIARNTQIILREECHLDRVIDPAGGSWFVEELTGQLAKKAWSLFQEVEKRGGMLPALQEGFLQQAIAGVRAGKEKAIGQRRTSIVGTNKYADPAEQPLPQRERKLEELQRARAAEIAHYRTTGGHIEQTALLEKLAHLLESGSDGLVEAAIDAAVHGATLGELSRTLRHGDEERTPVTIEPLRLRRAAEPFESLRAVVSASPKRKVFLANMGPLRQHKARADFSISFFQAGGFEVESGANFAAANEAASAALASRADIIVICSSDDTYPDLVPPLAGAIKSQSPERILVVAGYPEAHVEAFRAAGVDAFIHIRANCLETLTGLAAQLGISS